MNVPRSEHPKPQFERKNWMTLNGDWDFCIDNARSGEARGLHRDFSDYDLRICVPFCPQSKLSGLERKDFMYGVWYHRTVELDGARADGRVVLHIGAADFRTTVYVNGEPVGSHVGGYVSFAFDISQTVHRGTNDIVIFCEDDERNPHIPRGKQSEEYYSHGCDYTRASGWSSRRKRSSRVFVCIRT